MDEEVGIEPTNHGIKTRCPYRFATPQSMVVDMRIELILLDYRSSVITIILIYIKWYFLRILRSQPSVCKTDALPLS